MPHATGFDLVYFSALKVYGEDHHVPQLVARALSSGTWSDAARARDAIDVLPPHEREHLLRHIPARASWGRGGSSAGVRN